MLSATFQSCVSKKKYLSSENRSLILQNDSIDTHNQLIVCNQKYTVLYENKVKLQNENADYQNKLSSLSSSSQMTIAEQANRLKNLQNLIQAQKEVTNKLRQTMSDALVNFKADELSIYVKNGKVYVSLEEKLLFKSGSAEVDPKGKQALAKLSEVLNNNPDIQVEIEGHTDSIPIKRLKYEDNWALSTARATSIVRILTIENHLNALRVSATGKGEFHPIKSNETSEGRASNRRTEIILSPNLSELFKLLE